MVEQKKINKNKNKIAGNQWARVTECDEKTLACLHWPGSSIVGAAFAHDVENVGLQLTKIGRQTDTFRSTRSHWFASEKLISQKRLRCGCFRPRILSHRFQRRRTRPDGHWRIRDARFLVPVFNMSHVISDGHLVASIRWLNTAETKLLLSVGLSGAAFEGGAVHLSRLISASSNSIDQSSFICRTIRKDNSSGRKGFTGTAARNRWPTDLVTDRKERIPLPGPPFLFWSVFSLLAQISPVWCVHDHGVSAYRLQPVRICVIDPTGAARRPQLMDYPQIATFTCHNRFDGQ